MSSDYDTLLDNSIANRISLGLLNRSTYSKYSKQFLKPCKSCSSKNAIIKRLRRRIRLLEVHSKRLEYRCSTKDDVISRLLNRVSRYRNDVNYVYSDSDDDQLSTQSSPHVYPEVVMDSTVSASIDSSQNSQVPFVDGSSNNVSNNSYNFYRISDGTIMVYSGVSSSSSSVSSSSNPNNLRVPSNFHASGFPFSP
jgi:hypothetical protein